MQSSNSIESKTINFPTRMRQSKLFLKTDTKLKLDFTPQLEKTITLTINLPTYNFFFLQ